MRVVVGMSGGVDSSVTALLLKQQGHDVVGVFMKNWEEKDEDGVCTAEKDWVDVQAVCDKIDIPYYAVNFAKEYKERVFSEFLSEYQKGRTPNPDVLCNREIKFKAFLDFAMQLEAQKMATGHFVRSDNEGRLLKGADSNKDQSYFLYMLKAEQIRKSVFPVGGLTKAQVREIAELSGLPVSHKKDSTGVCFIGERDFKKFLQSFLPAQKGNMVTPQGEIVGKHDGLMFYTLGQRRGLGIGGRGDGRSFFVVDKDLKNNNLIVVQGEDSDLLYHKKVYATDATFVLDEIPENVPVRLNAKVRYRQNDQSCTVVKNGTNLEVVFDDLQRAVTPGQSLVLYDGNICLGGGIIDRAQK